MLSLHVVKCVIEWRKQLIYSFVLTAGRGTHHERNSINKFKMVPFVWEGENYLIKMKNDTHFLRFSNYARVFNFSIKSDPFLVFPASKHNNNNAVVGGAQGLKNLKKEKMLSNQSST